MNIKLYNQQGEEKGEARLPNNIFDVKTNPDLLYQVTICQMANRRQGTAHTKDRSEVRGGGTKPWVQKGTGRARHGSIRSPLWIGGGVTFGPRKEKNWTKRIPKKMRRKALLMALSEKARNKKILLLDELKIDNPKTKIIYEILKNLHCENQSCLIVTPSLNKDIVLAARNIPRVGVREARELNALDVLSYKYLIMPKESVKIIKETFLF